MKTEQSEQPENSSNPKVGIAYFILNLTSCVVYCVSFNIFCYGNRSSPSHEGWCGRNKLVFWVALLRFTYGAGLVLSCGDLSFWLLRPLLFLVFQHLALLRFHIYIYHCSHIACYLDGAQSVTFY